MVSELFLDSVSDLVPILVSSRFWIRRLIRIGFLVAESFRFSNWIRSCW